MRGFPIPGGEVNAGGTAGPHGAPAGFLRRCGAWFYDTLLVAAIVFVTVLIVVAMLGHAPPTPAVQALALVDAYAFYGYFWTRHGRTLGLQAWRMRIVDEHGRPPGLGAATVRFLTAMATFAPVSYLWVWIDRDGRSPSDIASRTRTIVVDGRDA